MISDMVKTQLKRHKLRTVLTILGVVIGILLITSMASISEGLRVSIDENIGLVEGTIYVVPEGTDFMSFMSGGAEVDESLLDDILSFSQVDEAASFVIVMSPVGMIAGFEPESLELIEYDVGFESGGMYESDTMEVALGPIAARRLGLAVGDVLTIRGMQFEATGISESLGNPQDDDSIWTSVENAQKIGNLGDKVSLIMVKAYDISEVEGLAIEITDSFDEIDALTDKDAVREMQNMVSQLNAMIYALGGIALIVAAIVIMNVMFMSVSERTREIGTMKAIGASNLQILSEVLGESIFISFIGGLIGVGLSFGIAYYLNILIGTPGFAKVTPRLFAMSMSFSILLGLIGGALPARKAAKLDPIVALRYE